MGDDLDRTETGVEVALQGDIEVLILCASAVVGEIEGLIEKCIEIDGLPLAAAATRVQQHALHDSVCTPAMLDDLRQVARQCRDQVVRIRARLRCQRLDGRAKHLLQLKQKLLRQTGKVVDEVQRVLDLMGNACSELAKRRHLFGVDQVGLGRLQLTIGLLHRPARFCGTISGCLKLLFALLGCGDVCPDGHRPAFLRAEFADAEPSFVSQPYLASARRIAMQPQALVKPRGRIAL